MCAALNDFPSCKLTDINPGAATQRAWAGHVVTGAHMKDRLISVAASLVFSVPTAVVIWLIVNAHLAYAGDFLGSAYLWASIVIFAIAAFVAPDTFPEILEKIWHWFAKAGFFWW
jgi:hypothetical protein